MKSPMKYLVTFILFLFIPLTIFPSGSTLTFINKIQKIMIRDYIYSLKIEDFINLTGMVESYIQESRELFLSGSYNYREWIETSMKMGYILGVYADTGKNIYRFGKIFEPDLSAFSHVYINDKEQFHIVHSDRRGTFIDIFLSNQALGETVKDFSSMPRWVVLFDENTGSIATIVGEGRFSYSKVHTIGKGLNNIKTWFEDYKLVIAGSLKIDNSNIHLIAGYSIIPDRGAVFLFGLIGLFILAIFLLYYLISYLVSSLEYEDRRIKTMGEEDRDFDVINEIDKEVTGLIEESVAEKKPEHEEVTSSSSVDKAEEKDVPSSGTEKAKVFSELESDGIFIRR